MLPIDFIAILEDVERFKVISFDRDIKLMLNYVKVIYKEREDEEELERVVIYSDNDLIDVLDRFKKKYNLEFDKCLWRWR